MITVLDIAFEMNGAEERIYPVLLQDKRDTILIDCGYIGFLPKIEAALSDHGIAAARLTKAVITHHDHDHMGALHDLKEKYPHIQVLSSKGEAPYISGQAKSLRVAQAEAIQAHLPEEQKAWGEGFIAWLQAIKPVPVDKALAAGDQMDWCGGCEIIPTPGHTPGHISLYLAQYKTMICGDAMVLADGKPVIANPQFALDKEEAERSLQKLLCYDAERFICYHGGVYTR